MTVEINHNWVQAMRRFYGQFFDLMSIAVSQKDVELVNLLYDVYGLICIDHTAEVLDHDDMSEVQLEALPRMKALVEQYKLDELDVWVNILEFEEKLRNF